MINVSNVTLAYGRKVLFKDVSIKFTPGNCYGVIGANGSGKSTFLKILAGEVEADKGEIVMGPRERMAVLRQDQFAFDEETVFNTVIMGHEQLYKVMVEREAIYAKPDFSEEDGTRSAELEAEFAEMNGYEAESEAAVLLNGLGIPEELRHKRMSELESGDKVRVLLAQALFGSPDILLLDEPTNNLDLKSISWLEDFLFRFPNTVIVVSHDRHFLNQVCTHTADIDFGRITVYVGNYDFWYHASQLNLKQKQNENRKVSEKAEELKAFIQRFSSNASKAKQATSRKKLLDKLTLEEMPVSSRKYPHVMFKPERPCGDIILEVTGLSKTVDGVQVLDSFDLAVRKGDKIAFVGWQDIRTSRVVDIAECKLIDVVRFQGFIFYSESQAIALCMLPAEPVKVRHFELPANTVGEAFCLQMFLSLLQRIYGGAGTKNGLENQHRNSNDLPGCRYAKQGRSRHPCASVLPVKVFESNYTIQWNKPPSLI